MSSTETRSDFSKAWSFLDAAVEMINRADHLEATDGPSKKGVVADLRARSISTAYSAAYAAMRIIIADRVVPVGQSIETEAAWARVYRGISHSSLQEVTKLLNRLSTTPWETLRQTVARLDDLRTRREQADYDPHWCPGAGDARVALMIANVAIDSIEALHKEPDSISLLVATTLVKIRR